MGPKTDRFKIYHGELFRTHRLKAQVSLSEKKYVLLRWGLYTKLHGKCNCLIKCNWVGAREWDQRGYWLPYQNTPSISLPKPYRRGICFTLQTIKDRSHLSCVRHYSLVSEWDPFRLVRLSLYFGWGNQSNHDTRYVKLTSRLKYMISFLSVNKDLSSVDK